MRRLRRLLLVLLATLAGAFAGHAQDTAAPPDLAQVMADPDWIGQAVEAPYWSADGHHLYYRLKREGSAIRDLYRVDPARGGGVRLDAAQRAQADGPPVFDRAHRLAAFVRHGDVVLRRLADARSVEVTRGAQAAGALRFAADGSALYYRLGMDWYRYDLAAGVSGPAAVLKFEDDPDAPPRDDLARDQLRLFDTLRRQRHEREARRAEDDAERAVDPSRAPAPIYLGKAVKVVGSELSPDGRWLALVTEPKDYAAGRAPLVTQYVTPSGYAETREARVYVGRNDPAPQSLLLVDLRERKPYPVSVETLPGIAEDPLAELRAKAIAAARAAGDEARAKALAAPATRPLRIVFDAEDGDGAGLRWNEDGSRLAVMLRANDHKDRWIAEVDLARHALVPRHRLHDAAWIGWDFNDFGWLKDGRTLWYLSEESGWSQLYVKPLDGEAKALTAGRFEVSHPALSADGRWFYLRANRTAPYSYDLYRVPSGGGELARLTAYQGLDDFVLAPDGTQVAVLHSSPYVLPQLAVVPAAGGAPRELTQTMKPAFTAQAWIAPTIVQVPSSHGAGTIHAKYYGPATETEGSTSRPAVIFVHGAGYLQNVTLSWPTYFREQMFHNLLVRQGYVVLDMDYRASAGYGRAWRTAIYRQMGHPELEDLLDGKAWLVREHHVDPQRVGIYGGSYGGFMTEMALLRAPGAFAAGAALRPVSDWRLYNHEYTSAILNDPQLDPEAYATSSPIEYAERLADPLLIAHGLIDDNVLAADSVRLYQRFVELHKKNFWISLYPLERHGFQQPDAWYDEYRRIDELFDAFVKRRGMP